jgi:hypothetical protein
MTPDWVSGRVDEGQRRLGIIIRIIIIRIIIIRIIIIIIRIGCRASRPTTTTWRGPA